MALNNYSPTIENVIFWLENSELVERLESITRGRFEVVKFKAKGDDTERLGYKIIPSPLLAGDSNHIISNIFSISNTEVFLKFYYRHVKKWANAMALSPNAYFLTLDEIVLLTTINERKHDINAIVDELESLFRNYDFTSDWRRVVIEGMIAAFEVAEHKFETYITAAFEKYPDKVSDYRNGKTNMFNMLFGEVLKSLPSRNVDKTELSNELKAKLDGN